MHPNKKALPKTKPKLHPRNKHRERYDFSILTESFPSLAPYVSKNKYGDLSIDFFDPIAVKNLNTALLKHYYKIDSWDIPDNYLCPPIPGRADYIHHIADLLGEFNNKKIPRGAKIKCLDIGVGANCIYPIIGNMEYGWSFIGSDIDPIAVESAKNIIELNETLKEKIEIRLQKNKDHILEGIIQKREYIDLIICNPPFHVSAKEAQAATLRKLNNLKNKPEKPVLNFGGQTNELWYEGGERQFVKNMVAESQQFATSCFWYSSLISKEPNVKIIEGALKKVNVSEIRIIPMGQGNKKSRIIAWTFLNPKLQKIWTESRWR